MAEVVKTGLLAGREIWRLEDEGMVRACAAFKAAVVLADPTERGRRAILNLGHTFAHGIEAAGGLRRADARRGGRARTAGGSSGSPMRHLGLDPAVLETSSAFLPSRAGSCRSRRGLARRWPFDKKASRRPHPARRCWEAPASPVFPAELSPDRPRCHTEAPSAGGSYAA